MWESKSLGSTFPRQTHTHHRFEYAAVSLYIKLLIINESIRSVHLALGTLKCFDYCPQEADKYTWPRSRPTV